MAKKKNQNLEEFIGEAIENIRSDRAITSHLLTELVQEMNKQNGSQIVLQLEPNIECHIGLKVFKSLF